jgi:euchromatic histone-lysine N-methyltransferase
VIRGFQDEKYIKSGKKTLRFTYDGLYEVVECWKESPKAEMVFKYKLYKSGSLINEKVFQPFTI